MGEGIQVRARGRIRVEDEVAEGMEGGEGIKAEVEEGEGISGEVEGGEESRVVDEGEGE